MATVRVAVKEAMRGLRAIATGTIRPISQPTPNVGSHFPRPRFILTNGLVGGGALTYMSIESEIVDRVRRGMLWPLRPRFPWLRVERTMLLGEALNDILFSPEGDDAEWEARIGKLRADLEVFITNERPIDPKYLFLLSPARDAVWEIRSVRDAPTLRVLGRFAMKDVFVATNYARRDELGGWDTRQWKEVKRSACAVWRQIFPNHQPIISTDIHDNVSGAMSGDYYRTLL